METKFSDARKNGWFMTEHDLVMEWMSIIDGVGVNALQIDESFANKVSAESVKPIEYQRKPKYPSIRRRAQQIGVGIDRLRTTEVIIEICGFFTVVRRGPRRKQHKILYDAPTLTVEKLAEIRQQLLLPIAQLEEKYGAKLQKSTVDKALKSVDNFTRITYFYGDSEVLVEKSVPNQVQDENGSVPQSGTGRKWVCTQSGTR